MSDLVIVSDFWGWLSSQSGLSKFWWFLLAIANGDSSDVCDGGAVVDNDEVMVVAIWIWQQFFVVV